MFELSETHIIKIAGLALFVVLPTLAAALVDRLLRHVRRETMTLLFWSLLATSLVTSLLIVGVGPLRTAGPVARTVINIGTSVAVGCFFTALVVGYVMKLRQRRA